jgi:hypothetical protein
MKKILLLMFVFISIQAQSQNVFSFEESWYVSGGIGTSVILGDIAPLPKLTLKSHTNEYKLGYMFRLGKNVVPGFDVNLEFLKGNISGCKALDAAEKPMDMAFTGDYWGLTLNTRLDILKFFEGTRDFPLSFYGRLGVGPLYYRAVKTRLSTGAYLSSMGMTADGLAEDKRAQTTVIPYGIGVCYNFSDNFRMELETSLYNTLTDNLDAQTGITKFRDKVWLVNFCVQYGFDWNKWQAPKFSE